MQHTLTHREMENIDRVGKGASSKEIARDLHIAVKTVEVHRHNILKKLKNSSALINFINAHKVYLAEPQPV